MKLRVMGPPDIIEPWAARFAWVAGNPSLWPAQPCPALPVAANGGTRLPTAARHPCSSGNRDARQVSSDGRRTCIV
jgi:hypothetical protein